MELLVLGCSGSLAGPRSPASGYLVRDTVTAGGHRVLMDIGPGVLAALQRHADPSSVDVALSHLHADHCLDFPSLLVWRRFHPTAPAVGRQRLVGPSTTALHLGRAGADHPDDCDDFSDTFDLATWDETPTVTVGGLTLRACPAVHPTESYCLRVEDAAGNRLVYSGDTGPTPDLVDLATGADVLLCEATWGETSDGKVPDMHLSGRDAGEVASAAGVGHLVLTHIPPWVDPEDALRGARRTFDGRITLARPDLVVPVGEG
ncbi:MBL fold metallo-hydrolase [Corynebacterium bovis]|uniref:Metallo-beta-lactamase domain-containing protein n=1 Tax=Corynebacterium bovis TaxID=36808 RepID=A0A3R8PJH5_9CORY|nr:MBL fold metallo-hydrolase [Corynebacterium bovis]MDK8511070.1 MBL fold metallo-hydrolase [Corynebacterium bovis]MDN8579779.1 MBL fold metallo-hydrolase [Corynebacterium bovis]RRO85629.1 hypothetical protein CXF48_10130 [Corynebacterium bovis]RRO89468.1 hypothetical protein CXF30_03235 [Corynebacterium bovis]RRO91872.1 hypothetical protein CXF40_05385 [Corynebacterium bovis]